VPDACQTLLFAATVGSDTTKLAKGLLKDPERVQIAPEKMTHDAIDQRLYLADNLQHKNSLLRHICADSSVTKAIIFSATKRDADSLARDLYTEGFAAAALHGDMSQNARNRTMLKMRRGKVRLLVATDVAARGIDITGISHVINFDLPRFTEDYVHRIGRTGRAGESGIAISFVSRSDLQYLDRIERYIGKNLNMDVIPGLEPARPLHRTRNTERKSNGRRPYPASNGGSSNGKSGKFKGRPFSFKETEGKSGYFGNGNGKRKPAGRDRDVVVEYRSAKPGKTGRSGSRKPENKVFTQERK
jgi:superfamily II DNA/RNA helicase